MCPQHVHDESADRTHGVAAQLGVLRGTGGSQQEPVTSDRESVGGALVRGRRAVAQVETVQRAREQRQTQRSRGRVTPEILDALKERALTEFSNRMNRASKADFEFSKNDILRIKP